MKSHSDDKTARRSFLRLMGGTLGASCLALNWSEVGKAASEAVAQNASGDRSTQFFTAADLPEVEAICAQIIPTDSTPGAREAGAVFFLDRALGSFFALQAEPFRSGLRQFQSACKAWRPQAGSFSALSSDQQIEFLRTVEHMPIFESIRVLTVMGMFAMPAYGGNRDGLGWRLLGFEDLHVFEPPFGYYDREYVGFVSDPPKST